MRVSAVLLLFASILALAPAPAGAVRAPAPRLLTVLPGDSMRVDVPADVLPVPGGAIVCGWTILGDAPAEAFVLRVDEKGRPLWRRHHGGAGADILFSLRADPAGGFVAAGLTSSRGPSMDGWIVALDDTGGVRHEITHGGPGADRLTSIARVGDAWLAAGQFDRDGQVDAWVLRTDALGNETARWLSGDSLSDGGLAAEPTSDGGCVIVGSAGASREDADGFVTRLAADFSVRWTHRFGGEGRQLAYHLVPAGGDSFLVTGYGDAGAARDMDASVRLIGPEGRVRWESALGDSAVDRGVQAAWMDDGTSVVIGYSKPRGPDRDGEPIWTTVLYGLDADGRRSWTVPIDGLGRESGRWIAGRSEDLWIVAPGPGGRVQIGRFAIPR